MASLYQSAKAVGRTALPALWWHQLRKLREHVLPYRRAMASPWKIHKILDSGFGHGRTVREGKCLDGEGQPIPWYTYPAVEYLKQLEFSGCSVFEYGSGNSTLFWASRARRVVAIERDKSWYEYVVAATAPNMEVRYIENLDCYVNSILELKEEFDVIIIDGFIEHCTRLRCCQAAIGKLKPGGMIILDNADWLPLSRKFLQSQNLIEVAMSGFVAIEDWTSTTSLFLRRDFSIPCKEGSLWSVGCQRLDLETGTVP